MHIYLAEHLLSLASCEVFFTKTLHFTCDNTFICHSGVNSQRRIRIKINDIRRLVSEKSYYTDIGLSSEFYPNETGN